MNKKSLICNGAVALASVLMLVFMAFDYFATEATGYQLIKYAETCFNMGEFGYVAIWLAAMVGLVLMIALLAYAVYKILRACNVIKSAKADKALFIAAFVCAIALVVVLVAAVFGLLMYVEFKVFEILGWALIVNTVLSIGSLVAVILGKKA